MTSLNDGGLSIEPPAADEAATSYTYPDWEWTNGVVANGPDGRPDPVRRVLTFTSAPLASDIEVTGPIVLKLYASSDQIDTRFIVKLADQVRRMTPRAQRARSRRPPMSPRAGCKASHREKDESRRPSCGRSTPTPIRSRSRPAKSTSSTSRCCRSHTCSSSGHRIRLEIANGDLPLTDAVFTHPYHPTPIGTDTIHHDGAHASCIMLPVVKERP